jgi:hypothetical protein
MFLSFFITQINGNLCEPPNIVPNSPSVGFRLPFSSPFCYKDSKNSPTIKITILTNNWGDGDFSVNFVNGGFYTHKYSQFVIDV